MAIAITDKIKDIIEAIIGIVILIFSINTAFEQFGNDLDSLRTLMKIFVAMSIAGEYRLLKRICALEGTVRKIELENERLKLEKD